MERGCVLASLALSCLALAGLAFSAEMICINFQPAVVDKPPTGYLPDFGRPFGRRYEGFTYSWSADNTARMAEASWARNPRYHTWGVMQDKGLDTNWEIELPNGPYGVHLVAGDCKGGRGGPSSRQLKIAILAEGEPAVVGIVSGKDTSRRPSSPRRRWARSSWVSRRAC